MKIDMSPEAITRRLEEVEELREACLALADSSAGRRIRQKHPDNPVVQRTAQALGDVLTPEDLEDIRAYNQAKAYPEEIEPFEEAVWKIKGIQNQ